MSTASEYGLYPHQDHDPALVAEVIAVPSLEWIERFGRDFEDEAGLERTPSVMGKFVAFNNFVVVAPFPRSIIHAEIVKAARLRFPDRVEHEIAQAKTEGQTFLTASGEVLTDAGMFIISQAYKENGQDLPMGLFLYDQSYEYGRAAGDGRDRTIEAVKPALSGVEVGRIEMDGVFKGPFAPPGHD